MANTIQHVCIYCRRHFKGKSSHYMRHIRKHRQWFCKYRYTQWKPCNGSDKVKHSKYLIHLNKRKCNKKVKKNVVVNQTEESRLQQHGSASARPENTQGELETLSSTNDKSITSPRLRNKPHRNRDGLPSMVESTRHLPSRNEKKLYKCAFCEKTFAGGSHLLLHERTHTGEKPHACQYCPKSFAQKGYLKIHERIHTGERPFKCTFCEKAFCTKEDLRRHERIHTGEKPYKCKVCARGFSQRSYRNKHESIHSGDRPFASKPVSLDLETPALDVDVFKLPDLPPALMDAIDVAGLLGTNGMTAEMMEKLKSMPEDQQQEFIDGLSVMSKKRKYYICRFCSRDCRSSSQLKQHERTHTGEKPFQCRFCQKSFAQRGYARIHERIHTGEKPFNCEVCDKAFAAKEDLRRHLRTHTGEKPYQCEVCGKAFAQNSALIGHRKTHLNELACLDYSSHSFVGTTNPIEEPAKPDFAHFLGPNFHRSARVLHMMASEASGSLPNLADPADKNAPFKLESPEGEFLFGMPPQLVTSSMAKTFPTITMANSLPYLPTLSQSADVTDPSLYTVVRKGIHDIAVKLLASKSEDNHSQPNKLQSNRLESSWPQNVPVQPPDKEQQSHAKGMRVREMSIVDHIRMQLSIPLEHPKDPIGTTRNEEQMEFVDKKKTINFLASQLSSNACRENSFQSTGGDVFSKSDKIDDLASRLLSMKTSKDPDLVNKKSKINDLASQLLSAQLSRDNTIQRDYPVENNNIETKDNPVIIPSSHDSNNQMLICDMSQAPQSDSIYHRAAQLLQPKPLLYNTSDVDDVTRNVHSSEGAQVKSEPSGDDEEIHCPSTDIKSVSIADKQQAREFNSKKKNINGLASHLAKLSAKTFLPNSSSSFKSINFPPEETSSVAASAECVSFNRDSLCAGRGIDNIAAQLIFTKSNEAANDSDFLGAVSSPSFEEEILQRKQEAMLNNDMCSTPIKPSITSIIRPLQGIANRKVIQNM